ncbi:hypothetical protein EVAR_84324_1 [Eumeta japonica]|uniref:Secreted protein n=1 Tax=Eumeta variegata TaxID=151549 RepID=A0A4C1U4G6_EUMVA|nr:hypothetical protein EVAR_84324_1 [Eumeta japonica]
MKFLVVHSPFIALLLFHHPLPAPSTFTQEASKALAIVLGLQVSMSDSDHPLSVVRVLRQAPPRQRPEGASPPRKPLSRSALSRGELWRTLARIGPP